MGGLYSEGRWHTEGTLVSYAAFEYATAAIETYVHTGSATIDLDRRVITAELPLELVLDLPEAEWPAGWNGSGYSPGAQELGRNWVMSGRSLAPRVPSAVLSPPPGNLLLNPSHPEVDRIRIVGNEPFTFDARLVNRVTSGS